MFFNDKCVCYCQALAFPFAGLFGGEKRIENPCTNTYINSWTIVYYGDFYCSSI